MHLALDSTEYDLFSCYPLVVITEKVLSLWPKWQDNYGNLKVNATVWHKCQFLSNILDVKASTSPYDDIRLKTHNGAVQ